MNILLIYPYYPDSFWGFKHALKFIAKKAAVAPLGLLTVSAILPKSWHKKLVDLNTSQLNSKDIISSDFVFISAMYIQKESVGEIIKLCRLHNTKIVAGGPLFTQEYANYPEIDYFVLNEAEITLPPFVHAIESGIEPKRIYSTKDFANMCESPIPDYHLLNMKAYANMSIQVSRGCPYACDFCEITTLLGHKVRMKTTNQVLQEINTLYRLNWRGSISIVDDNFIGNKKEVKNNLIPAIRKWMKANNFPFLFNTQTSINLADDDELLEEMTASGFNSTFIGIETPDDNSLHKCNKVQNENRNLLMSIKKIQRAGMIVSGGFIVGFDSDLASVFQRQIDFIQRSGIVTAMVGLLNAPKNTVLYNRLKKEKRLTIESSGNNTDSTMNFIPKMNRTDLINGYKLIIQNIYSSKPYYKRVRRLLLNYKSNNRLHSKFDFKYVLGLIKSATLMGFIKKGRLEYWKFIIWTLFKRPKLIPNAIVFTVYGYHFRKIYGLGS